MVLAGTGRCSAGTGGGSRYWWGIEPVLSDISSGLVHDAHHHAGIMVEDGHPVLEPLDAFPERAHLFTSGRPKEDPAQLSYQVEQASFHSPTVAGRSGHCSG